MRDYGKVHTSFWSSPTIRSMSEDARTLAFYLVTSPHSNMAGAYRLPDGYVCEDLNWPPERVAKAFAETLSKGFANRCETTKWVWVCKHFTWNPPENPNQRKGVARVVESIPEMCAWKLDFMRDCGEFFGFEGTKKANPSGTLGKPFRNQEPEPEPEQDIEAAHSAQPSTPDKQKPQTPRGTRLPKDWTLPDGWREWAEAEREDLDISLVADSFRDFWWSKAGQNGSKLDWLATWRNWVRNQRRDFNGGRSSANSQGMFAGAI